MAQDPNPPTPTPPGDTACDAGAGAPWQVRGPEASAAQHLGETEQRWSG